MKKILLIIGILISVVCYSQGPQTTYTVTSIANMKTYSGKASRVHVTATNEDYINCPACTPDEVTMYDGAGSRVWKLTPEPVILSSTYFDGSGTVGDPTVLLIDATPTDASVKPVTSNAVFDGLSGKQATLVSGTNIKTVNGTTLLGSGDLVISAGVNYAQLVYTTLGGTIKAESIMGNLSNVTTSQPITNQVVRFTLVYLPTAATITGVKWWQQTQGAYTADNYNGVALYSLSAGTMTLVASSTNDGNIWKATTGTLGSKAFTSTYSAAAGVYVAALLYCRSAESTAPVIGAYDNGVNTGTLSADFANSVKLQAALTAQTSFPGSQAYSGVTVQSTNFYLALY